MHNNSFGSTHEDAAFIADVISVWGHFFMPGEENQVKYTLAQSIIFKLRQARFHLCGALYHAGHSMKELTAINPDERAYHDFAANCNIDAMIYALNSVIDIIAGLINEIYGIDKKKCGYFSKFRKGSACYKFLQEEDPATAKLVADFNSNKEREYIRKYCNYNKHEKGFFSAGAYIDLDIQNDKITSGYNMKNRYRRNADDRNLIEYGPTLLSVHKDTINKLGRSLLRYMGIEPLVVDDNFIKQIETMFPGLSTKYSTDPDIFHK